MATTLPLTGTNLLLELVSPYVPDDFIHELCPRQFTGGRRCALSAPPLWRAHLLPLLTSTRSLNLLVAQWPEQAAWRRFCRLGRHWPGVRMLHEFRHQVGVSGLRRINQHLLERLLRRQGVQPHAVALMDATDLPAACSGFKKKHRHLHRRARGLGRAHAQDGAKPLVRRLQETHPAVVAAHGASGGDVGAAGQLAGASQRGRGRIAGAEPAVVCASLGLVARTGRCRYGVSGGPKQADGARTLAKCRGHQAARRYETVAAVRVECPHGARLEWWEHEPETAHQWFRVANAETLCDGCWQAGACPRHFAYPVAAHETLFGLLPLASRPAQRLLQQVRPWIEPAQSFEKNQLGLGQMFFNSLRLAWQMSLWADSAVLLRTMAWLDVPAETHLLAPLTPRQLELGLRDEK